MFLSITENPCVPGSIPGGTTYKNENAIDNKSVAFFGIMNFHHKIFNV